MTTENEHHHVALATPCLANFDKGLRVTKLDPMGYTFPLRLDAEEISYDALYELLVPCVKGFLRPFKVNKRPVTRPVQSDAPQTEGAVGVDQPKPAEKQDTISVSRDLARFKAIKVPPAGGDSWCPNWCAQTAPQSVQGDVSSDVPPKYWLS